MRHRRSHARRQPHLAVQGVYQTGFYQPLSVSMGSAGAKNAPSPVAASVQDRESDDGASAALELRNRQYNMLKDNYERSLFIMAGLAAAVVYLFATRGQS